LKLLNVYYDTEHCPATFDFGTYLVSANAVRQLMKLDGMKIMISAAKFRKASPRELVDGVEHDFRWRVKHILGSIPHLLPSVKSVEVRSTPCDIVQYPSFPPVYAPGTPAKIPYTATFLKNFYGQPCDLRPYRASVRAKDHVKSLLKLDDKSEYVTMTFRTSKFQPERNSNLTEWFKVYEHLKEKNIKVLVIPDFEDLMTENQALSMNWDVFVPAVFDHDLRLALYEMAADNYCINNGVIVPLMHSEARYKLFKWLTPGVKTCSPEWSKNVWDLEYGEDFKFSNSEQELIWEQDTYEVIMESLSKTGPLVGRI